MLLRIDKALSVTADLHIEKRLIIVKYGKTSVQYPRMTSFCGTVNDDEFLIDQTGNRRFAVIPLDNDFYIEYSKIKEFNFVQLWAEINSIIGDMLADGKTYADCFRFNRDELQELEKRNGNFIKPIPSQIEIEDMSMDNYNGYPNFFISHKKCCVFLLLICMVSVTFLEDRK